MSDEKKTSLVTSAWRAALALLGTVVVAWIAMKLLLEIWWILAIVIVAVLALWLLVRWLLRKNRW